MRHDQWLRSLLAKETCLSPFHMRKIIPFSEMSCGSGTQHSSHVPTTDRECRENPAIESGRLISHTQFSSQLNSLQAWDHHLYTNININHKYKCSLQLFFLLSLLLLFTHSLMSDSLWPHRLQHARLPLSFTISGAWSNLLSLAYLKDYLEGVLCFCICWSFLQAIFHILFYQTNKPLNF